MHISYLRWMIMAAAIGPFVYYALATYCGWEFFHSLRKRLPPDPCFTPPVSILKPVRGVDREAYENFTSFCRLDYPQYEIVFAVADQNDPVVAILEKLQRDFPARQIRILTDIPRVGTNRKVNKLCLLSREARYDLLAISDSDVRVDPDYLREMVAPLDNPDVGLVTALFRGIPGKSFASRLDALGVPAESGPSALVARKLEGNMKFAFGWSMATTKQHLAEIGGFEAIANHHSDDFELGNRISSKGYRVELMRKPVWMVFPTETTAEFIRHELRWAIGLRNVRKLGYLGLVLTFGLPWTVLAAIVAPSAAVAVAYVLAYLGLRLGMAWMVGIRGLGDPATRQNIWLIPLRDLVNFGTWVGGLFSNKIHWRGFVFRVRQGLLVPVPPVSTQTENWNPYFSYSGKLTINMNNPGKSSRIP